MKSVDLQLLVIDAQIAALKVLRSGAASAELADIAVQREKALNKERTKLAELRAQQGKLELDTPAAA